MSEVYYNHEFKERFLEEREITYVKIRKIMRPYFNITKEYEEKLTKDCSAFTSKEILDMYASMATRSWERLLNMNSQLKLYTGWCVKEGLVPDHQNHYEEIDKHDMYQCLNLGLKNIMIITRGELEKNLQNIPNVSDQFLALAIFEGLGGIKYGDFYNLMPDQFSNGEVTLENRKLKVSNKLIELAYESANDYTYYYYDEREGHYREDDLSVVKDHIRAFTDSLSKNHMKIYRRIALLEKYYGKAYSYVGLRNSGRVDMISRLMKEDNATDPKATFDKHKSEIEERYGKLQRSFRWLEETREFFPGSSE